MTDWLMVIITAIYVVATIIICYFNGKSAKAAKIQTEEMIRQYNLSNRPNVTIHFDIIRSGLLCFVVENEGNMPAHDVNIHINEKFIAGINDDRDKAVSHVIVHNSTVEESHKYRIYKYLCCEGKHTTIAIADELKMDKDYVLGLLIELLKVDKLVGYYPDDEVNDDNIEWYRC